MCRARGQHVLSRRHIPRVSVRTMERRSRRETRSHFEPWRYCCRRVEHRARRVQHRALVVSRLESARASLLRRRRPPRQVVKRSTLPTAGLGLFTAVPRRQGEDICDYVGVILDAPYRSALDSFSTSTPRRSLDDKTYLMRLGPRCYVDASEFALAGPARAFVVGGRRDVCCFAPFAHSRQHLLP